MAPRFTAEQISAEAQHIQEMFAGHQPISVAILNELAEQSLYTQWRQTREYDHSEVRVLAPGDFMFTEDRQRVALSFSTRPAGDSHGQGILVHLTLPELTELYCQIQQVLKEHGPGKSFGED